MTVPQVQHKHVWLQRFGSNGHVDMWSCRCGLVSMNDPAEWTDEALDPRGMTFSDWLESTIELQTKAFGHRFPMEDAMLASYAQTNLLAAMVEIAEMSGEIGWKPWADDAGWVNREKFLEEAVDAMHFVANMLCAVGITGEELSDAYKAKQQINRERQANGYSTQDKTDYIR